ncbi:Glycosyl hydrolase family 71 domain containing protein [Rhypophila decipiens]
MRLLFLLATALFAAYEVQKHDWKHNIELAREAKIDAFALNIHNGWPYLEEQLDLAFSAVDHFSDFKLFISFDYAGNGPWEKANVTRLINKYKSKKGHYRYNGKPFASTFEGPDRADDWVDIKADTGCFFIPDWSSRGAFGAINLANQVVDGLFSWAGWPWGDQNMDTYTDASYNLALGQSSPRKPYMMPVSPWFFTNLPGYNKNWMWNGNDLWYDRWIQVLGLDPQPEFLQIISWNDFGESHYIGPLDDRQYEAFQYGGAPYNYVKDMPHDGWRKHLPWLIDMYKKGTTSSSEESVVVAYRRTLRDTCGTGNTTLNTATQLQYEFSPAESLEDRVQITALLNNPEGDRKRTTGFKDWDYTPQGGIGLHHVSLPLSDLLLFTASSDFKVTVSQAPSHNGTKPGPGPGDGKGKGKFSTVRRRTTHHPTPSKPIDLTLPPILKACPQNRATNWNAYVASTSQHSQRFSPPAPLSSQVCTSGWGRNSFDPICNLTCKYGYCPSSACVCTSLGDATPPPKDGGRPVPGYPFNGDANYGGLCNFVCKTLGSKYCSKMESLKICSTTEQEPYNPPTSPFQPPVCVGGKGNGDGRGLYSELCSYTCKYGFCPIAICECTATGGFPDQPAWVGGGGHGNVTGAERTDQGLCNYACDRGYCPSSSCSTGW